MKETFDKNNVLTGYETENIRIHSHIDAPDSWHLTIRKLNIFGKIVCNKSRKPHEIKSIVYEIIKGEIIKARAILDEVY